MMKDNKNLIEEIAQKQAEIAEDIDSYIQSGGSDGVCGFEYLQNKNNDLGKMIEELQQLNQTADLERLAEIQKGEKTND